MREFIRLQLKLKWGFNRNNGKAGAIMTAAAAAVAVAIALALVWVLSIVLRASIAVTARELSALYLTLIAAGLTVAATGMQIKRLYRPGDMHITARFPLGAFKLFASYLIINYIDLTIYSAALTLPIMLVFGFAARCISAAFVGGMVLCAILMPIVPFVLSIFLAIPAVAAATFLDRHGIVRIVAFAALLVGAFVAYYFLLNALAQFFIHRNWTEGTLEIWKKLIRALAKMYNPAFWLSGIVFFENFWACFGATVGAGIVIGAGGIALARVVCATFRRNALDSGNAYRSRPSREDGLGSGSAILRHGLMDIVRSKTYSYFYLGVAVATPVMVFFCNRLVSMVGTAQIGTGINFGASMIVVSAFMAMICSFTGAILSGEGKTFYITKLSPVPYRKQLLVKAALYMAVSAGALAVSAAVIGGLRFVSAAEMSIILITQVLLIVGLVLGGINLNLSLPNLKPKANGEPEEINITYMLIIGLALAAAIGAVCVIFPRIYADGKRLAYIVSVAIALAYAAINMTIFFLTANKKYTKIEV